MEMMSDLERQNRLLKQLLIDADAVARRRGDAFGLCDSVLPDGEAYPSHTMGETLESCRAEGFSPCLTLDEALRSERDPNSPWHESINA